MLNFWYDSRTEGFLEFFKQSEAFVYEKYYFLVNLWSIIKDSRVFTVIWYRAEFQDEASAAQGFSGTPTYRTDAHCQTPFHNTGARPPSDG